MFLYYFFLVIEPVDQKKIFPLKFLQDIAVHALAMAVKESIPGIYILGGTSYREQFFCDFIFRKPFEEHYLLHLENRIKFFAEEKHTIECREMLFSNAIEYLKSEGNRFRAAMLQNFSGATLGRIDIGEHFVDFTGMDIEDFPEDLDLSILRYIRLMNFETSKRDINGRSYDVTRIVGIIGNTKKELKNAAKQLAYSEKQKSYEDNYLRSFEGKVKQFFVSPKGLARKDRMIDLWKKEMKEGDFSLIQTASVLPQNELKNFRKYKERLLAVEELDAYLKREHVLSHVIECFSKDVYEKDLPLRFAEYGPVFQKEEGLYPGHFQKGIEGTYDNQTQICLKEHLLDSFISYLKFIKSLTTIYGIRCKLSLHKSRSRFSRSGLTLDNLNTLMVKALNELDFEYKNSLESKESFHLSISFLDASNQEWKGAYLSVDQSVFEKKDMFCIDAQGRRSIPFVVHSSVFGLWEYLLTEFAVHMKL